MENLLKQYIEQNIFNSSEYKDVNVIHYDNNSVNLNVFFRAYSKEHHWENFTEETSTFDLELNLWDVLAWVYKVK